MDQLDALDELAYGLRSLAALRSLLIEIDRGGVTDFEALTPRDLGELVGQIDTRLQSAGRCLLGNLG